MLKIAKWTKLGITVTAVSVLVVLFVLVASTRIQIGTEELVVHTLDVERTLQRLDTNLGAVDGDITSYVISQGGPRFLAAYHADTEEAHASIDEIEKLVSDNRSQTDRIHSIRAAFKRHLVWCEFVISEANKDGFTKALASITTGPADESDALLRWTSKDMATEEERLLIERQERVHEFRVVSFIVEGVVGLVLIVSVVVLSILTRRHFSSLRSNQLMLEQSRKYLEGIVSTLREPLLVIDSDFRIRSANRAFHLCFGSTADLTDGADLRNLGEGEWADPELLLRVKNLFATGEEVVDYRLDRDFPGKGRRSLRVNARKIYRPGNHTGLVMIGIEDMTDHDLGELRLKQANAELESFAYTVAHDLRAPLRALQGFSAALEEDYSNILGEVGRGYTGHIIVAASRMDQLIRDLLEYSRFTREDLRTEPVALADAVSAAMDLLAAEIEAKKARVSVEGTLPFVQAHYPTLVQVLANLISNGMKFVEPGVVPQVRIWTSTSPGRVRLWVADNGIGIAPEHHARIFKVFERLHGQDQFPGTGIGLAIVQKVIARQGGSTGLESTVGVGSRFWIELPSAARST